MKKKAINYRGRLKLFTALTLASSVGLVAIAKAQSTDSSSAYQNEEVHIIYKKLKLREKDIPNAISVLGQKQVQAANPTLGSIQTLLTQTPSVVAYTQQPGQNNPTLAIRGVSNQQLAETLDGVPINDLLDGENGYYLSNGSIGSQVTLNEIDGVTVYPGLAPPAKQGFGTTGGTIAYTSKQPTDDRYEELEGGYGSFDTSHIGFVINTGKIGDGPDAPKALLLYDQSQSAGYVDNTQSQFHDFEFNLQKPYDNGNSNVGLLILFNQGKGYIQTLPAPTALIDSVGYKFNYPKSLAYYDQADQDLTTILSDETYINPYAIFNGSLFYHHNSTTIDNFASAQAIDDGYPYDGISYTPNVQGIANFFGCVGTHTVPGDPGDSFSNPAISYDPVDSFGSCAAGESDNTVDSHTNVIGITPTLTLFPDRYNTVVIGGLIAKTTGNTDQYVYGGSGSNIPQEIGYNAIQYGGGQQRTIYSGYVQDTIRLLNNKLQITPGLKVDSSYGSNIQVVKDTFGNPNFPGTLKLANFTKIGGYYLGASYNLPKNFVLYGSAGKGSLFAPVDDYSEGTTSSGLSGGTNTLEPEIVHLYEGGLRYDTDRLLLNVDYYYEDVTDAFGFFQNFLTNQQFFSNTSGNLYRGVEGNGDFQVTPDFSLFGNFSYNTAIYVTGNILPDGRRGAFASDTLSQDQFGVAFTGTPLSNVPAWNGLLGFDYENGPFTAYFTGQYTGQEYTTYDLQAEPFGDTYYVGVDSSGNLEASDAQYPNGAPSPVIIPGSTKYGPGTKGTPAIPANPLNAATVTNERAQNPANVVCNILLTYKIPVPASSPLSSLTASLNLQNIFDERYYTYTYSSQNPVGGIYDPSLPGGAPYDSGFIGEPRSVVLDLVAKF